MIPFSSAVSTAPGWNKLPHNQGYELHWTNDVVGTLKHPTLLSSGFQATSSEGNWTFRRIGLLGAGAEIVESISQQPIARFKSTWSGRGTLIFADGQRFHLECRGIWHPVWSITTEAGHPLLSLHSRQKNIELAPDSGLPANRVFLLAMFTLYRFLTAEEDAASAALIAAVS